MKLDPVRHLEFTYSKIPPTENSIRMVRWGRDHAGKLRAMGLCYTKEAEDYRQEFRTWVQNQHFVDVQVFRRMHKPWHVYTLQIHLYFPASEVLNVSWLKGGKNRPKGPYKRMDAGNRRKLLEDCFAEAIDLDDSLYFETTQAKLISDTPCVKLILTQEDPRLYGVPEEYLKE